MGNVQGVQRYGRSLKTDPDEGEGYSYHVYPVAYEGIRSALFPVPGAATTPSAATMPGVSGKVQQAEQLQAEIKLLNDMAKKEMAKKEPDPQKQKELNDSHDKKLAELKELQGQVSKLRKELAQLAQLSKTATEAKDRESLRRSIEQKTRELDGVPEETPGAKGFEPKGIGLSTVPGLSYAGSADYSPYPPPFDATAGIRNFDVPLLPVTAPYAADAIGAKAVSFTRAGLTYTSQEIYHQPLIQVKVRVVEVARGHQLLTSSVLDYIGNGGGKASLITTNTLNGGKEGSRLATRFNPSNSLIGVMDTKLNTGAGLLVNLTSEHLNYIASLLATELNADLITAPEVVTLNGQNVEFVAGSKLPFALGQNVIQGNAANIQQFFYKHVGTFISVTPRIVNWGLHGEGAGSAVANAEEIVDWRDVLTFLDTYTGFEASLTGTDDLTKRTKAFLEMQRKNKDEQLPVAIDIQGKILDFLKRYPRSQLKGVKLRCMEGGPCDCNWSPKDCTIDLSVVVRLSDEGRITISETTTGTTTTISSAPTESDIRAIANVIQVKSGHGVVMAGLIGEREIEEISKVPVLGDLPGLGFFFRSKGTNRQKTEVLIFIEAQVLDTRPECARVQSAHDFTLSGPYVAGEFLENPLEYGMYRAGFGTYLPPHSKGEQIFWERFGRQVRKACTTVDDTLK